MLTTKHALTLALLLLITNASHACEVELNIISDEYNESANELTLNIEVIYNEPRCSEYITITGRKDGFHFSSRGCLLDSDIILKAKALVNDEWIDRQNSINIKG